MSLSVIAILFASPPAFPAVADKSRAMDQFIRGTVADQMGDHYRAVFHYREALRYDSTSPFLNVALAQAYILLGNTDLADEQLDRALRIDPNHVPALELKVVLSRGLGDMAKTRSYIKRLLQAAPSEPRYLRESLALALSEADYDHADRLYRRLVEIEGESDDLMKHVLAVYLMAGQHKRALPMLQELHRRDTTDAAVTYSLGTTYLQAGDTANGAAYMRRANRMDPEEPRYWVGLTLLALDEEQYEQVITFADTAVGRVGPHAGLAAIKGNALNRLGRTVEAITTLHQAIELDSSLFSAMGTLALIYDRLDSLERVEEMYERAIRLSDSAAVYMNNLAYAYAQRGINLEQARRLVERALELDPENASYLDTMGWIEYRLGRTESAIRWLRKAVQGDAKNAEVLEHLGDAYAAQGARRKAQQYYRQALEQAPDNEQLRQKLAR